MSSNTAENVEIVYPDLPEILMKVKDVKGDVNGVGRVIGEDKELAKEVLATINAPYFDLVREIKSTEEAARMLGINRVVNLTTGRLLRGTIFQGRQKILNDLWATSVKIAVISVLVAKETKLAASDEVYTAALMHNSGMALMTQQIESYAASIKPAYFSEEHTIDEYEEAHFGMQHSSISAQLAMKWGLSGVIAKAIQNHHDATQIEKMVSSGTDEGETLLVLKVAEHITRLPGYLAQCVQDFEWEKIKDPILDELRLTEGMFKRFELTIKKKLAEIKS